VGRRAGELKPEQERAQGGPPRAFGRAALRPRRVEKLSGCVRRTQRPPFTTARNDEFAPWCLSGAKFTSGPLKMSRYFLIDSSLVIKLSSVRFWPEFFSPINVRSAATQP